MDEQYLREFLETYVEAATDDAAMIRMLQDYAPFKADISMAAGWTGVVDKNGNQMFSISVNYEPDGEQSPYCPSVPVHPGAMAMAKLTAKFLNMLAEVDDGQG